jgi:hypothetical protein
LACVGWVWSWRPEDEDTWGHLIGARGHITDLDRKLHQQLLLRRGAVFGKIPLWMKLSSKEQTIGFRRRMQSNEQDAELLRASVTLTCNGCQKALAFSVRKFCVRYERF